MEDLNFSGLLANCSNKGRTGYNPIMMYAVITMQICEEYAQLIVLQIYVNEDFRRFNYRSSDKVYKEFMLFAIGRNINKYHRFLHAKLKKFEGKLKEKIA